MKLRVSNLLPLSLVLILAGLSLWLRIAVEAPAGDAAPKHRGNPDAHVENFTVVRLDDQGLPRDALSARQMTHYPGESLTELVAPRIRRSAVGPGITITADRGQVRPDGDEAFFQGNVLVMRERSNDRPELRIHTEFLEILADQGIARTDQRVTITEGQSTLTGVGMHLEKGARQFTLHSQVRGRFEPPRN